MAAYPLKFAAAAALYLIAFIGLASLLFVAAGIALLYLGGTPILYEWPDVPDIFWQWINHAWNYSSDPNVSAWLINTAIPAAILPGIIGGAFCWRRWRRLRGWTIRQDFPTNRFPPRSIRGSTDNYGHARWATINEAQQLWPGSEPLPSYGAIALGEAYDPRQDKGRFRPHNMRSWGKGGQAPLLLDPCREEGPHSIVIAGTSAFKTVCAATTLCTWKGSAVVLDPAAELGPMLKQERLRMGHSVHVLSPETAETCGCNVLDYINITSPLAEIDVLDTVERICGETPSSSNANEQFFKNQGKALVACLLADLLWDTTILNDSKTLRMLREIISLPEKELKKALEHIYNTSPSSLARHLAGPLFQQVDETFSGIFASAHGDTRWLATKAYADLVSGSAFHTFDICCGDTDVFLSLPLKALSTTPAVARCIIGALINAAYEADGAVNGRILFLLDEAARLGYMNIIRIARDAGRKFGISLHLLYQDVGQIKAQWGENGKNDWYENVSWRAYAAIKDYETAKDIADTIGQHGVLGWSESTSTSGNFLGGLRSGWGKNTTYTEHARAVIRPEEIMNDLRSDCQLVIAKGIRPVVCGRAIYFRRPEFVRRISQNRFIDNA